MALTDKLIAIGDAIRTKTGATETMTLDQMANAISEIETGGGSDCIPLVPYYKYKVDSVEGASYGFALNENGYYESQNKGQQSSYALCRITITTTEPNTDIIFSVINFAESNYDYGMFGNLDKPLSLSSSADSDVKQSYKGKQDPLPTTLTYTVDTPGEHFIDVKFIKDSSQDSNNDSVQFKFQNDIEIPEEYFGELRVVEPNLVSENIVRGVDIFGVTGSYSGDFPNGTRWTKNVDSKLKYEFKKVLKENGLWVAVTSRYFCYSEDGMNWTIGMETGSTGSYPYATTINYVDGLWFGSGPQYGLWYSLDGKEWNPTNITGVLCNKIVKGGGVYVAQPDSNGFYYSTDGINWIESNNISGSYSLIYFNGIFVAGGLNQGLWYSLDGKEWTQVNKYLHPNNLVDMNGVLVCLCSSYQGAYYSLDGKTWERSNKSDVNFSSGNKVFCYADGMLIATGLVTNGPKTMYYTYDGITFNETDIGDADCNCVRKGNGLWVASSYSNGLFYSYDGKTWTQSNIDAAAESRRDSVYYANGVWVSGSGTKGLYYSLDGKTWTQSNITDGAIYNPIYSDCMWVLGMTGSGFAYSSAWSAS